MRILLVLLIFLCSTCPGRLLAQDGPWRLKLNEDGIPVYIRSVEGSPIIEYRAHAIIDAPIPKVIALFEDEKQIQRWYYQCVRSELVQNENPNNKVIYLILHLPWPVAARDFVFRRTRTDDSSDGSINYSLTALPDRLPHVRGMVRVRTIKSLWSFKPLPNNQTEMFFQQHTDPAGSIPPTLVNKISVDTPLYSLKNFRKLIELNGVSSR